MNAATIRQKLHNYLEVADIERDELEYTDEFKAELDRRVFYYKNGGKMVGAGEAKKQIQKILTSAGRK